jgi:hypothetical protein
MSVRLIQTICGGHGDHHPGRGPSKGGAATGGCLAGEDPRVRRIVLLGGRISGYTPRAQHHAEAGEAAGEQGKRSRLRNGGCAGRNDADIIQAYIAGLQRAGELDQSGRFRAVSVGIESGFPRGGKRWSLGG